MSRFLSILIIGVFLCSVAIAQNKGQVNIFIDSLSFYPGDQIPMKVVVNIPRGAEMLPNSMNESLTSNEIELISMSENEIVSGNTFDTYSYETTITAWEPKSYEIPSLTFTYSKNNQRPIELVSKTYRLQVKAPNISGDSLFLVDIKPIIEEKKLFSDYLIDFFTNPIVQTLLAILCVAGLVVFILRFKKRASSKELSPEEIAINLLEELKQSSLIQDGHFKEYHSKVSLIVRQYIHKRFGIRTLEVPTPIFIHDLKDHPYTDSSTFEPLCIVLKHADLIKFAKASPLNLANTKAIESPLAFIESTKDRMLELEQMATDHKKKEENDEL